FSYSCTVPRFGKAVVRVRRQPLPRRPSWIDSTRLPGSNELEYMSRAARTVSDSMTADSPGMYVSPPGSGMSMNSLRIGGTPLVDEQAERNSARAMAAVANVVCLMAPTLTTRAAAPQAFCVGASIAGPVHTAVGAPERGQYPCGGASERAVPEPVRGGAPPFKTSPGGMWRC